MEPGKSFFPVQLPHLPSASAAAASFLSAWPSAGSSSSPLFLPMVVPPTQIPLKEALQQVTQQKQLQQQQQQQRLPKSPETPKGRASADSDDDDLSSDAGGSLRKRSRKHDESEGNSGGDDDKTKKRREQIAAASRASRARRKRELEDLRAETKQLKDEREKYIETIQRMQRKVEDLQQRPILLLENANKAIAPNANGQTFPNVICEIGLRSVAVVALMTILRDKNCTKSDYVRHSNRLCRILVEEGLARCKLMTETRIHTPTNSEFLGLSFPDFERDCCTVSIMRSGDIISDAIREIVPTIPVGKVLIQRQEDTPEKNAVFYWSKLPHDISQRFVIVCDPMLGTGGTITACLKELVGRKVNPKNVLFLNIISCPEGLTRLHREFPEVTVVTCAIDPGLDNNCYIVPGLGDYGDRFFHTEHKA